MNVCVLLCDHAYLYTSVHSCMDLYGAIHSCMEPYMNIYGLLYLQPLHSHVQYMNLYGTLINVYVCCYATMHSYIHSRMDLYGILHECMRVVVRPPIIIYDSIYELKYKYRNLYIAIFASLQIFYTRQVFRSPHSSSSTDIFNIH